MQASDATATHDDLVIDLRDSVLGQRTAILTKTVPSGSDTHERLRIAAMVAVIALVALNLADVVTTRAFLSAGVSEGNPVGRLLITSHTMEIAKAVVLLILGRRAWKGQIKLGAVCAMWFVTGVYACAICVNLMVLRAVA